MSSSSPQSVLPLPLALPIARMSDKITEPEDYKLCKLYSTEEI
jgi:hypothetical protein